MKSNELQWSEWLKLCESLYAVEKEFIQVIDNFKIEDRDKKNVKGKWSVKDILSHIVGWEIEIIKQFKAFLINPNVDDNYDIDSFNQSAVKSRKHLNWDQIVLELKTAQAELFNFLSKLTQKEIDDEKRFIEWVDVLINHYVHHTKQLNQLN